MLYGADVLQLALDAVENDFSYVDRIEIKASSGDEYIMRVVFAYEEDFESQILLPDEE